MHVAVCGEEVLEVRLKSDTSREGRRISSVDGLLVVVGPGGSAMTESDDKSPTPVLIPPVLPHTSIAWNMASKRAVQVQRPVSTSNILVEVAGRSLNQIQNLQPNSGFPLPSAVRFDLAIPSTYFLPLPAVALLGNKRTIVGKGALFHCFPTRNHSFH